MNVEPVVNESKYKVKFTLESTGQDSLTSKTDMCVRILKVDDTKVCVEFSKQNGNAVLFHEHFNEITKKVLNFAIDATL